MTAGIATLGLPIPAHWQIPTVSCVHCRAFPCMCRMAGPRAEPCACGTSVFADPVDPAPGVRAHQATAAHAAWRERQGL